MLDFARRLYDAEEPIPPSGSRTKAAPEGAQCDECGSERWVTTRRVLLRRWRRVAVTTVQCEDCGRAPF